MALVIFLPHLENLPQNLAYKPHFEALPRSGTGCFEASPRSGTGCLYPRLAPLDIIEQNFLTCYTKYFFSKIGHKILGKTGHKPKPFYDFTEQNFLDIIYLF